MKKPLTHIEQIVKDARTAERARRKASDPRFGKSWPTNEMGRSRSKAGQSRSACRGRVALDG